MKKKKNNDYETYYESGEKEGIGYIIERRNSSNGKIYKGLDDSTNIVFIKAIWKFNDIYKKYLQCE